MIEEHSHNAVEPLAARFGGRSKNRVGRPSSRTRGALAVLLVACLWTAGCGEQGAGGVIPAAPPPSPAPAPDPAPQPPATPAGLRVSASGADFIEWTWSPVADADGYEVQFSLDAAFTAEDELVVRTSAETSYRRSSLPPETVGFLQVRSLRGTGEARLWSEWSPSVTGMTGSPPEPPATPTGLQVSASGADFIEWTWSPVADADGYEVQFSLDAAFTAEDELVVRTSAETSYRRSSLSAGTVGFLRVRSVRGTAEARLRSEWSRPITGMTAGDDGMTVLGKVTALPVADFLGQPANFFDLEGRTVTFTPDGKGQYAVEIESLAWVETSAAIRPVFEATEISLPFGFPFAGRTWTRVHINRNGNVSFLAPETAHWEQREPWSSGTMRAVTAAIDSRSAAGFEAMIAALWAVYGETAISVDSAPTRVAITWNAVRPIPINHYYEPAGPNVFQVRLYPSGVIELAYRNVPERDGIVGLFHGRRARGRILSTAYDDSGDVSNAALDIVSAKLIDNGSTVIAAVTLAADIPERVSSGLLEYKFHLGFDGVTYGCTVSLRIDATGRTPYKRSRCGGAPRAVGYAVQGPTLEIPISKILRPEHRAVTWSVEAVWSGGPNESDRLDSYHRVDFDDAKRDLSSMTETVAGNLFEVFNYPSIPKSTRDVFPYIYGRVPATDEFAVVFTDFRFDDLYNTGPGSGPINVPVLGIGDKQASPRGGSQYLSDKLLSAVSPKFIGGPRFVESGVGDGYEFHGHSYGVRHLAHELVHRWSAYLQFRNPVSGRIEDLRKDSAGHWSEWLHVPERYPVWSGFSNKPYSTGSVMSGGVWQDNGDGTFTRQDTGYPRAMGLSDLDLYAMGMIPPEEVRPTFLLRDAVETVTRDVFRATKVPVRIEDIIAAMGPRVPSTNEQRKVFRLGVYLLHLDGRPPRAEWLARAHNLTEDVVNYFSLATSGRPAGPQAGRTRR